MSLIFRAELDGTMQIDIDCGGEACNPFEATSKNPVFAGIAS